MEKITDKLYGALETNMDEIKTGDKVNGAYELTVRLTVAEIYQIISLIEEKQ